MRVLHLGKFFPPVPGGIERFSAALIQVQAAAGIQVAGLMHGGRGSPRAITTAAGARVEFARHYGRLLFVPVSPSWPLRLRGLLRGFRPDLIHVQAPNPSAFWMLGIPAARRIPWIVHWHSDVPHDARHLGVRLAYPPYRLFESALLNHSAAVIATSEAYADASAPLQSVRERVRVVPLGIDDPSPVAGRGPALPWPSNGLRVLAVGRLSYYKGFQHLLDAIAALPGVSLLLIGDGERRGALSARVRALGIGGRVTMAGNVEDSGLLQAYADCDLVCLPSLDRAEAFGLVLLEAARAGKPVVASAVPGSGINEVVVDGVTGLLAPPGDAAALADRIARLAADPALRQRMGRAGRERFERHYRIEAIGAQISRVYERVLGRRAPP
ncbi:MAG TPA: glycosyltransferase [Xanthomonadaceae bacterium]|nr:glycosyltransferase [Xanthomonadaceae bacterium]